MPRFRLLALILALSGYAHAECQILTSARAVIECALANSPQLRRQLLLAAQGERLEAKAAQRPNPEIGARGVIGNYTTGGNASVLELNAAHVVELGGKRDARIERAEAESDEINSALMRTREEVFLATLKNLYRLRQIHSETQALEEALSTFSKIQTQYRSRLRLSPEHEVSLGVIRLAEADYKLKRARLESERSDVVSEVSLAIGRTFDPSEKVLPPPKARWPQIEVPKSIRDLKGSDIRIARAHLRIAQSDLSLAQSESWPDLKIGPSFEAQSQGPFAYQTLGANLTFAIPLFHANGAGRALAHVGVDRAETSLSLRNLEVSSEIDGLVANYHRATRALGESIPESEVISKHQNLESFFSRGIIPSALVIESHRQIYDFTKTRNEMELAAIDALWRVYAIEGRMFEESL